MPERLATTTTQEGRPIADLTITRGDRYQPFKATLKKRNLTTGKWEPIDLTSASTVTLYMLAGTTRITATCTFAKDATGKIEYEWTAEDTEVTGQYRAQAEILWANGKTQSVPDEGYAIIEIQPDLAGDA